MGFGFLEYFSVIFFASFVIFSLNIKTSTNKQSRELSYHLNGIGENINKEIAKDKKDQLQDVLGFKFNVFKLSIGKVSSYIYHSFYLIFFISATGMLVSFFVEMEVSCFEIFDKGILTIYNFIIPTLSILLWYFVIRGSFLLICFSKIDHTEYVQKVYTQLKNRLNLNFDNMKNEDEGDKWGFFKIFLLKILFLFFLIFDKTFKQFYYRFYKI